jgi:hypothetical protein
VLNLTILFLGAGLVSLLLAGDGARDDLVSCDCALPERSCLLSSKADDVELDITLRLRVFGGEGGTGAMGIAASGSPLLRMAFVKALSFMGTGISSSELSLVYFCDGALEMDAAGSGSLRWMPRREGSLRRACLWDALLVRGRASIELIGVGDAAAIVTPTNSGSFRNPSPVQEPRPYRRFAGFSLKGVTSTCRSITWSRGQRLKEIT